MHIVLSMEGQKQEAGFEAKVCLLDVKAVYTISQGWKLHTQP